MYAILLFPGETSSLNYVLFFFFSQHEVGEFRLIPFPTVSESFFFFLSSRLESLASVCLLKIFLENIYSILTSDILLIVLY